MGNSHQCEVVGAEVMGTTEDCEFCGPLVSCLRTLETLYEQASLGPIRHDRFVIVADPELESQALDELRYLSRQWPFFNIDAPEKKSMVPKHIFDCDVISEYDHPMGLDNGWFGYQVKVLGKAEMDFRFI